MNDVIKVFVYGTLKKGGRLSNPQLQKRLISSEKATLKNATLYDLGAFPGISMRNEEDRGREVVGELHLYKDPSVVVDMMDQIEGVGYTEATSLFVRKETVVVTSENEKQMAIVYEASPTTLDRAHRKEHIISGEW